MSKLKNYNAALKLFVLILTIPFFASCNSTKLSVEKIEGKEIKISDDYKELPSVEAYIKPYRDHITADLSTVLAVAPQTLDKSGKWQSTIGNLFADISLQLGNTVFQLKENKKIDMVLLNHGGIRAIIPQGNVTARTAYQIMPFENNLVVIELKSEQIREIVTYIIKEKKPHPIAGLSFTIDSNFTAKNIKIGNQLLDDNRNYYVGTNDYLANGGDNMLFFLKGVKTFNLDYKMRNVLIDYFKMVDVIPMITDERIKVE